MNKYRLNQIIDILLFPFCEKSFYEGGGDRLADLRLAFYEISRSPITDLARRRSCEKRYLKAEKAMTEFVRSHAVRHGQSMDDIFLQMDLFYPEDEIADLVEDCFRRLGADREAEDVDCVCRYYFRLIFRVAKSLLTFRDGKIAIRTWVNREEQTGERDLFDFHNTFDKVEIWNLLCRSAVPDVWIAAFFVECGLTDYHYLYNQTGGIFLADKTLDVILKKGIAETHMHFNAGIEYITLWEKASDPDSWEKRLNGKGSFGAYPDKTRLYAAMVYRILFAEYVVREKQGMNDGGFRKYIRYEWPDSGGMLLKLLSRVCAGQEIGQADCLESYPHFLSDLRARYPGRAFKNDFLLETLYVDLKCLQTFSEIIFLVDALSYIERHELDVFSLKLFIQYLRVKNDYFSIIMQPNGIMGLDYFRKYFSNAKRAGAVGEPIKNSHIYKIILMGQAHNVNLKKMEIRIAPELNMESGGGGAGYESEKQEIKQRILKKVELVIREYLKYAEDTMESRFSGLPYGEEENLERLDQLYDNGEFGFPTLGIVFHFIKMNYIDNRIGDMCWLKATTGIPEASKHMLVWRRKMAQCAECIEELRGQFPYLAEYIVGIDAASNECDTEPWVMAPVYRFIRNRRITKPLLPEESAGYLRIPNIGFTYHVGEEFRHILSGLRHIDEVLDQFSYKAGDRIGHAIALGADLEYWVGNNEVVVIPVEEQLENLVWLWGSFVHGRLKLTVEMEKIEGQILGLAKRIYGSIQGLTPMMLYEAYLERFQLNHEETFRKMAENITESRPGAAAGARPEVRFCKLYDRRDTLDSGCWTKDKLLCTSFCPVFREKMRKPVMVPVDRKDLPLYKQVQEQMIHKIEKMGVYVETNPTSNVSIGQIESLFTHYITNLNSVDPKEDASNHAVLVTINSDDPVVFSTNAENELSYVYHALVHKGYKKELVLQWIDKVRQYGLDSCFIRKIKKPSAQIAEMKKMLEYIEDYYKHG